MNFCNAAMNYILLEYTNSEFTILHKTTNIWQNVSNIKIILDRNKLLRKLLVTMVNTANLEILRPRIISNSKLG